MCAAWMGRWTLSRATGGGVLRFGRRRWRRWSELESLTLTFKLAMRRVAAVYVRLGTVPFELLAMHSLR